MVKMVNFMLCVLYHNFLKLGKKNPESRMVVSRAGLVGVEVGNCLMGIKFRFLQDEKFLEICCTTMCM